ncbi:hypothetical protein THASP1DRAFT_26137 [Thamnocephalis sphaerospora]|uniref:Uncharacterized protein n=1 Tax=Thamnocephalis sphaerospora TaxID=78915 RepID=A0A4P9XJH7_9FUNG|nr:hypothetical protein THASP1DRAFT_26137 [Thamnocephalis sphaerospora]|eukprot:RKP05350.1 hypothetical protein THASP1DRAFT_26137 [Thamnocephalis sphaerospora]
MAAKAQAAKQAAPKRQKTLSSRQKLALRKGNTLSVDVTTTPAIDADKDSAACSVDEPVNSAKKVKAKKRKQRAKKQADAAAQDVAVDFQTGVDKAAEHNDTSSVKLPTTTINDTLHDVDEKNKVTTESAEKDAGKQKDKAAAKAKKKAAKKAAEEKAAAVAPKKTAKKATTKSEKEAIRVLATSTGKKTVKDGSNATAAATVAIIDKPAVKATAKGACHAEDEADAARTSPSHLSSEAAPDTQQSKSMAEKNAAQSTFGAAGSECSHRPAKPKVKLDLELLSPRELDFYQRMAAIRLFPGFSGLPLTYVLNHDGGQPAAIGFDTESTTHMAVEAALTRSENLHLSSGKSSAAIRARRKLEKLRQDRADKAAKCPPALEKLLAETRVLKVGVRATSDADLVESCAGVRVRGVVDLDALAAARGHSAASLAELTLMFAHDHPFPTPDYPHANEMSHYLDGPFAKYIALKTGKDQTHMTVALKDERPLTPADKCAEQVPTEADAVKEVRRSLDTPADEVDLLPMAIGIAADTDTLSAHLPVGVTEADAALDTPSADEAKVSMSETESADASTSTVVQSDDDLGPSKMAEPESKDTGDIASMSPLASMEAPGSSVKPYKLVLGTLPEGNYATWDWDARSLSQRMIHYAALDAVAGLRVFEGMLRDQSRADYRPLAVRDPMPAARVARELFSTPTEERTSYWPDGVPPYATGSSLIASAIYGHSWWVRAYPRPQRRMWAERVLRIMVLNGDLEPLALPIAEAVTDGATAVPHAQAAAGIAGTLSPEWLRSRRFRLSKSARCKDKSQASTASRAASLRKSASCKARVAKVTAQVSTTAVKTNDAAAAEKNDGNASAAAQHSPTSTQAPVLVETRKSEQLSAAASCAGSAETGANDVATAADTATGSAVGTGSTSLLSAALRAYRAKQTARSGMATVTATPADIADQADQNRASLGQGDLPRPPPPTTATVAEPASAVPVAFANAS